MRPKKQTSAKIKFLICAVNNCITILLSNVSWLHREGYVTNGAANLLGPSTCQSQ